MKKTLRMMGLCALAALALAGCKKNVSEPKTFKATISQLNSDAKTEIGTGNWLVWSDNDQIKVYNADKTETATFNIETGVGTKEATFSGTLPESNTYYAFYPTTGVELTPEYVTEFTLSGTQTFVEGNFASNLYPMYAISTDGNFSFYSPCGVLGIPMKGTATIGSILLTDSLGMDLAGTFEMAGADVNFQDTHSGVGITLSFGEGLTLNETTATLVYFVVPAGALSNGFKADVKGTDGNRIVLLETSTPNPVAAETIHLMPEVTGVNGSTPGPTVPAYGPFSVSATQQVYFSPGNLWATTNDLGSTWTWSFAEHQYDKIGNATANSNITTTSGVVDANGSVDLFGWSTSSTYFGILNSSNPADFSGDFVDWATNAITNGGNPSTPWRTLSKDEWSFIFGSSPQRGSNRYAFANIHNIPGLIIFPDNFLDANIPGSLSINNVYISTSSFPVLDDATWAGLEDLGCAFLPTVGQRYGSGAYNPDILIEYWTSTPSGDDKAYRVYYSEFSQYIDGASRYFGYGVRLARNAN